MDEPKKATSLDEIIMDVASFIKGTDGEGWSLDARTGTRLGQEFQGRATLGLLAERAKGTPLLAQALRALTAALRKEILDQVRKEHREIAAQTWGRGSRPGDLDAPVQPR